MEILSRITIYINEMTNIGSIKAQCRWITKTVTTKPPIYIPHEEFSWHCDLSAPEPCYVVLILQYDTILKFQKFDADYAQDNISIHLSFFPCAWNESDDVRISLYQNIDVAGGGIDWFVVSDNLKKNPIQLVKTLVNNRTTIGFNQMVTLAIINIDFAIRAKCFLVSKSDTEKTHRRWRMKERVLESLEYRYAFLEKGRLTGKLDIRD